MKALSPKAPKTPQIAPKKSIEPTIAPDIAPKIATSRSRRAPFASVAAMKPLSAYDNGGVRVEIYPDGTKVREVFDPAVPPVLPEQMDLKITDWCDAGCAWCHERSTPSGKHGDMRQTLALLSRMPAGSEVAIGGGDPLSHPDFEYLVLGLRDQGVIPSVTVNGRHLQRHLPLLDRLTGSGSLFGVGISYAGEIPQWDYPHAVLHLISGVDHPSVLDAAGDSGRKLKILLLGYKRFGRGQKLFELRSQQVQQTLDAWFRELFWVARQHHLSFDNLAIEQLKPARLFAKASDYKRQWMGPEGEYSMYIDAVTRTFALSSYSPDRMPWSELGDMFAQIRNGQGFECSQ